jgi:hypothetical protein
MATIVTDNAYSVVNIVECMFLASSLTCTTHCVQLAVNKVMARNDIDGLYQKAGKIVGNVLRSNLATHALEFKQQQLHVPKRSSLRVYEHDRTAGSTCRSGSEGIGIP